MPGSAQTTGFQSKCSNKDSDYNYFEGKTDLIKDGGTLKYCWDSVQTIFQIDLQITQDLSKVSFQYTDADKCDDDKSIQLSGINN